jgi:signal transduction histidine kinase
MKSCQELPRSFDAKLRPTSLLSNDQEASLLKVQISFQSLFFNNKECRILRIRDVTAHKQLVKAENENKMLSFLQASVSHELLTPIKCIGSFAQELIYALISNSVLKYKAELIHSTSKILLSQVKFLLDKSMLD